MRLRDFELCVSTDRERNWGAYPLNEGTRLFLATTVIDAPFVKIAPSICTDIDMPHVSVVDAVCLVDLPAKSLPAPEDAQSYAQRSLEVLTAIELKLGWSCPSLVERYDRIRQGAPPCVHEFWRLRKTERKTGVVCSTHFEAIYRSSVLSVRFSRDGVTMHSKDVLRRGEPIIFYYEFPLKDAVIRDGNYMIRDGKKKVLSTAKIPGERLVDS